MTQSDRRRSHRQNEKAAIQVLLSPNHSSNLEGSRNLLPAELCNKSEGGLYIEIDHSLQPGSTLSIKMDNPAEDHPEEAYYMYDGRVIWCKRIGDKPPCFGGGIEITRKVVRADILSSRF